ncbi:glucosyltransferase domain-containing protein [Flavobacterium sp.]|jgi:hypothetical protein|uniref:glucosyltransferase domain-containing protein n=1 Tax=Flavobacterium sp. TaxID=239 RepID=UPI0022C86413|nr:glucosyltransferase domain-containing protein [Flavobacterium sp.]MCZ8144477.1 glucosyltransferase domain-containing protein [Flavobacterium sp.]MCZ8365855.1 glucosyltransferase domain-containing protein [Flavobacterium sp.]
MPYQDNPENKNFYKLFLITFALAILAYGFALSNFTVSIDNEAPIFPDFGMSFGRWGQNLIRYHLFAGFLQYFTLLLSLFLFSLSAVKLSALFKFNNYTSYFFCALFVTFPQLSYQLVFSIMADVAGIGFLLSVISVELFLKGIQANSLIKKILLLIAVPLLLMFTLSIYQAFVLVPITIFVILFFIKTFEDTFELIPEIKKTLLFIGIVVLSILFYSISVKLICPPIEKSEYLSSFVSGNSENIFSNFLSLCKNHLKGTSYYGEKLYILIPLLFALLLPNLFINKKYFVYRILILFFLSISPFIISFFITNGYHPPRLYLTSNLIFAFGISLFIDRFKISSQNIVKTLVTLIVIINIYFVTNLFYSVNKIYKHDKKIAEKIDSIIQSKYPNFSVGDKTVYFYGYFNYDYHQKFRLENSEIFGGSFFSWDNGNNYRIINFIKEADVADYKMLESKEKLSIIKDSITNMKVWPDYDSVKMIDNVVVVKLGKEKGAPLYFE